MIVDGHRFYLDHLHTGSSPDLFEIYPNGERKVITSDKIDVEHYEAQLLEDELKRLATKYSKERDIFYLGRGLDYVVAMEGSLKLKEISYIHSEAYASGELKHGPIALITEDTPVVALVTQAHIMSKELSNIKEVKARGANVVLFIKEELAAQLKEDYNVVALPDLDDKFMVFPSVVALQLLAYYVSSDKGFDVDKPRNLAKVVTVE